MVKKVCIAVLVIACCAAAQERDFFQMRVNRIHERAIVVSGSQFNTNQFIVKSSAGLILVDSGISPAYARELKKIAFNEFKTDTFVYVINTHHHWDHIQGNQVFPEAITVGHQNCLAALIRQHAADRPAAVPIQRAAREGDSRKGQIPPPPPSHILVDGKNGFQLTPPAILFDGMVTIKSGDVTMKIYSFGAWHTDNDLLVFFPELGILASGDVFFKNSLPVFTGRAAAEAVNLVAVLDTLLHSETRLSHIVPGHNELLSRDDLVLYRDYIHDFRRDIRQACFNGSSLQDAQRLFSLNNFPGLADRDISSSTGKSLHEGNIRVLWSYFEKRLRE